MGKFKNPQTITSTHPDQEDFGYSVAIHNGYVVVGDPYKNTDYINQGEVHVFRLERGEFRLLQDIKSPNRDHNNSDDNFGEIVAIHNGYIVIGAPYDDHPATGDDDYGSVYVYRLERGEFRLLQHIKNPDKGSPDDDRFGISVAISDGYIVVGAPLDNVPTNNEGSVYVYRLERGEFRLLQHIKNPEPETRDNFGFSVAIHDGFIVVGNNDNSANSGSGYVFRLERGEFRLLQHIKNPDKGSPENDYFGSSVAISDGFIVVGAGGDNDVSGSVYVYRLERGEFRLLQRIQNPDGSPEGDRFGVSVAIHDGYIVVGASFDNGSFDDEGSVYVYRLERGEFKNPQKLESPDKKEDGEFGFSVAIHDGRVVVGQPYGNDSDSSKPGTAYIFSYGY